MQVAAVFKHTDGAGEKGGDFPEGVVGYGFPLKFSSAGDRDLSSWRADIAETNLQTEYLWRRF
jgi:hypothetical protein